MQQQAFWLTRRALAVGVVVVVQWIAADPKGRAVMIGAVEKQKLVYIFNRDASANLTISYVLSTGAALTVSGHADPTRGHTQTDISRARCCAE